MNLPRNAELELVLDLDEGRKHADDARGSEKDHKDPEVQLQRRPVVRSHICRGRRTIVGH